MERSEDRPQESTADAGAPLVSVITVNHNRGALLADLLSSLRRQSYTNHEVVVVDNASTDGSLELLRRDFPEVRVLAQSENLGFTGGNNAGIRAAKGELVALANNDTVADPRWLEELVRACLEDPRIGAVGSKILFLRPFVALRLEVEGTARSGPAADRPCEAAGMIFGEESGFVGCDYDKVIFREGIAGPEPLAQRRVRRTAGEATVFLPIPPSGGDARLRLVVAAGGESARPARLCVDVGSTRVAILALDERLREHVIDVPAGVVETEAFDVINNAGTALSVAGEAADRGIDEPDRGQYDLEEDVEAVCGAAVLFRRSALAEVGLFDRDFFMYYEDTDLSWRLRSAGYRLRYQPRSVIRHRHAATSVEWSPLFIFYTVRNKILMIVKNGDAAAFLRAYGRELRVVLGALLREWRGRRAPDAARTRGELVARLRAQASLLKQIPRGALKRAGWIDDRLR